MRFLEDEREGVKTKEKVNKKRKSKICCAVRLSIFHPHRHVVPSCYFHESILPNTVHNQVIILLTLTSTTLALVLIIAGWRMRL